MTARAGRAILAASRRGASMANDQILWLTTIPVECPECSHKTPQTIAGLIARDNVICASCGHSIGVKGKEWRGFVQQISERLSGLTIPSTKS